MLLNIQPIAISQVTQDDVQKLLEAKPSDGKALVYSSHCLTCGLIVLVSEEEEYRKSDFADYSPKMQAAIEWAHQRGASYLMFSEDNEVVDFDASSDKTSIHYDEVMEAVVR